MRLVRLVHREPVDLRFAMHRVPEIQPRAQLEVALLEDAFEQQDRAAPAQLAHALGFRKIEQREPVGAAQRVEDALDAMAVGVGLDDGEDACVAGGGAGAFEVAPQRFGVDEGLDRTGHAASVLAPRPAAARQPAKFIPDQRD